MRYVIGPRARNAARVTFATGCWPAFLTTRRDEVGERAVRTSRKPGGGKRREPLGACNTAFKVFHESRVTKHESRPFFACFDRQVVRNAA